uniref:Elongator complex protein 2 n=1 Tax=Anisakis simplex TaxID=6269 RepID=A0A0M3J2W2_ANISI
LKASSKTDGVHSRIIWTCSWSSDDRYFATGARDKKVALWSVAANDNEEKSTHVQIALQSKRSESVTAIAFCPCLLNQSYVLAIGLENGQIELVAWNPSIGTATDLSLLASLDGCRAHSQTIARLRFRPKPGKWMSVCESEKSTNENIYELASVANDNAVKVHRIHLLN